MIQSGTEPTFWAKIEKVSEGSSFYKYAKNGDKPNCRYVLLFNLRTDSRQISFSQSLYDSETDCLNECKELDEMYQDHPLPILFNKRGRDIVYDYSNNRSWWGYIVLDFVTCKIIRIGGYGFYIQRGVETSSYELTHIINKLKIANTPACRDYFFRDTDKVPDDYDFDYGEYEGWLQYQWGDHKNAIDYVAPPKQKKSKVENQEMDESTFDESYENYEADLLENKFADVLDKETRKKLMNKFGW